MMKNSLKKKEDFVNKINILGLKRTVIDENFFEELEEILITVRDLYLGMKKINGGII